MTIDTNSYFANIAEARANSTWIQGIGAHKGKCAFDLVIGDHLVWNGGSTSEFVGFGKETAKFVEVKTISNGKERIRRMKKDRIVAVSGMGVYNVTLDEIR